MKYSTVIFDLDGTITATHEGIFYCLEQVFGEMKFPFPPKSELNKFIGPPLGDSFLESGMTEEESVQAIKTFQKFYNLKGKFMCRAYDGIADLLHALKKEGASCYIATTKDEAAAKDVIANVGLTDCFDYIAGSTKDQSLVKKEDIIAHLFEKAEIKDRKNAVMIGDKRFDIYGAEMNGIDSIGVLYGYGSREELSGATYITESVAALKELLIKKEL